MEEDLKKEARQKELQEILNKEEQKMLNETAENKQVVVSETKPKNKGKIKEKKTPLEKWTKATLVISIILAITSLIPLVSSVIMLGIYLFLVLIIILTLFTLLFNKSFMSTFENVGEITTFIASFIAYTPYVLFASGGFMAISLLLTTLNKQNKRKTGSIIAKSIFTTLFIVVGVLFLVLKTEIKIG